MQVIQNIPNIEQDCGAAAYWLGWALRCLGRRAAGLVASELNSLLDSLNQDR